MEKTVIVGALALLAACGGRTADGDRVRVGGKCDPCACEQDPDLTTDAELECIVGTFGACRGSNTLLFCSGTECGAGTYEAYPCPGGCTDGVCEWSSVVEGEVCPEKPLFPQGCAAGRPRTVLDCFGGTWADRRSGCPDGFSCVPHGDGRNTACVE